ncbi:ornithine carbamoyltransferase [Novosphingobium pentaromativorans]|uniref:Ornithine carbamoyltransferase n=1 Tax=Novosphingobium pentaromativorans US6-1 TaxID=1088721 RepID=G6EC70_9SPHN|nr:ornithine carbamoyltransferase [Novosphingobium pentaromativorans]AIT80147.1 ornithine carbamoyltransferase [Novosphingobium pentaromativorans US6-1]EHJ61169.1 ornithine carbamoyltransferase [Novosphingobium pentaromativorans US6-1]
MTRHFLSLSDAGGDTIAAMLNDAIDRKAARKDWPKARPDADAPLAGHVLAMIFEKNSTRTRVSFDMAMRQLGGSALIMEAGSTQLGRGETVADTARVLSRMVDAIMIRTDDHAKIEELAHYAEVPVINGLTDLSHPCQIVADLLTVVERGFALPGLQVAWLGDGNNVANSLIEAAGQMKFTVRIGGPAGYEPNAGFIEQARAAGAEVILTQDPAEAVKGAQVVVTDTWVSMGQPGGEKHVAAMQPYQVNAALMAQADPRAMFLHCLPAHREEEVTNEVIDGPQSAVWDEAENRLHSQKSVLLWALGKL